VSRPDDSFALHDLLTLRLRDRVGLLDRAVMRPKRGYIHYRSPAPIDPVDIDIQIGPFELQPPPEARRVDRRFTVAPDYLGCDDTYKVLGWRLELQGWESARTRLRIQPSLLGTAAIGSRIIDCVVRYELCRRTAPAVHSCGIVRNGRAFLLSGRSGVGKSTLAMRLLDRGATLLGDNWIIVNRGLARSFHLPINIYHYNVAPMLRQRLPSRCRADMRWKRLVCAVSAGYLKKSTPVVLREVLPELVAEEAPLHTVFLLSQGPRFRVSQSSREDAIARLVANDMMDREAFYRYMQAYATVFPRGLVAGHWERLREALDKAMPADTRFLDIVVERRIGPEIVDQVEKLLET